MIVACDEKYSVLNLFITESLATPDACLAVAVELQLKDRNLLHWVSYRQFMGVGRILKSATA